MATLEDRLASLITALGTDWKNRLKVAESSAPASPAAGNQWLFIDTADHKLKRKDSSGVVTTVEGGGSSILIPNSQLIPSGADDLSSGWSSQNMSTITRTAASGGYSESWSAPYGGAQFPWALRLKTTALTSAINLTGRFRLIGNLGSYCFSGLVLRNSTTGNFMNWGPELSSGAYWGARWNGTTYNAGGVNLARRYVEFYRMRVASGTLFFELSPDGVSWITVGSEALSAYLGSYDQIGYGMAQGVSGDVAAFALDWIKAA